MKDEKTMPDIYEINRAIHTKHLDIGVEHVIDVWSDGQFKIIYAQLSVRDREEPNYLRQLDELRIYKDDKLIAQHSPHLDPYVTVTDGIVCMTSDEECWLYDLDRNIESTIGMEIVAFWHRLEFDSDGSLRKEIPNTFCVTGTGCYWGFESWPQEFEYYIDKDTLKCVDSEAWEAEVKE